MSGAVKLFSVTVYPTSSVAGGEWIGIDVVHQRFVVQMGTFHNVGADYLPGKTIEANPAGVPNANP